MHPGGLVAVYVMLYGPSDGAPRSAVAGVVGVRGSRVDDGHPRSREG